MQKGHSLEQLIRESFENSSKRTDKYDSYYKSYAKILENKISANNTAQSIKLLEIGVKDGGSLEAWRKILGNKSLVVGLDKNPECLNFDSEQHRVIIGDQNNLTTWQSIVTEFGTFDVIIDDGSHIGSSQSRTIDLALKIAIGEEGIVIIEDTHTAYIDRYFGDGHGMNFMDKVKDIAARMNARSGRIADHEFSKLAYVKPNDIARRSIECISMYESITAFYIKRNLKDSKRCGSDGQENIPRIKDLRKETNNENS